MTELPKVEYILTPQLEEVRRHCMEMLAELDLLFAPELQRLYDRLGEASLCNERAQRAFARYHEDCTIARKPFIDRLAEIQGMANVRFTLPASQIDPSLIEAAPTEPCVAGIDFAHAAGVSPSPRTPQAPADAQPS